MMSEKEILEQLSAQIRLEFMEAVRKIDSSSLSNDKNDTVTLYHGTTTANLNAIDREGILPRKQTGKGNWDDNVSSIENVTYLTNKWHYSYAIHAYIKEMQKKHGENFGKFIKERTAFPCYVECKVPKGLLVMDEDYIFSSHYQQKLKSHLKKNPHVPYMELPIFDAMECLAQYGTVGVVGNIPPSMIVSFTVLGDESFYEYLLEPTSPYVKEWDKWRQGKGKGKMKLKTLWEKEAESDLNGTWYMNQVKPNTLIHFGLNTVTGKLAMQQQTISTHA